MTERSEPTKNATRVRIAVPEGTFGTVSQTLLQAGVAAAVGEQLGERAELEVEESRNAGWGVGGELDAEPGAYRCLVRIVPGDVEAVDPARAEALVAAVHRRLDDVLGPAEAWSPQAARVVLSWDRSPQLPQGNPQVRAHPHVTAVTAWG